MINLNIFDLHCDTLLNLRDCKFSLIENKGHISENALIKGEYLAQCFAIYTSPTLMNTEAFTFFKEQHNLYVNTVNNSELLKFATNKTEINKNFANKKISCILTVENAEFLNNDLENFRFIQDYKISILGLIHNGENCLGYPNSFDKKADLLPLKPFGLKVVDAVNSSNTYIDVSHLNYGGFNDVIAISKRPVVATHSACRDIFDHPRNLYDNQIKAIAQTGGIIGVNFYSKFLNGTNKTKLSDLVLHIKHLINVGGEDVVALGSDFDGIECELPFKNCGDIQILCEELIKTFGFSVAEKICYKNALRLF